MPEPNSTKSASVWARIVIVAYKSADHLQHCVDALRMQTKSDFEVIVVDNACPERCTDELYLPDERFTIVSSQQNQGFAGGSNFGAHGATTEWIITLNPDATPDPFWLEKLFEASERSPVFDVLSSTLVRADEKNLVDGFGDVLSIYGIAWRGGSGQRLDAMPNDDVEVFGACGAAACYRRVVFETFGGFDRDYFCYLEDVDLAFRFQTAGVRCLQVRDAIVSHVGSASSTSDLSFPLFQSHRNNLRLILRNAPLMLLPVMLFGFCAAQIYINLRNIQKPESRTRVSGLVASFKTVPSALASRKTARAFSKLNSLALFRRLALSPFDLRNQRLITF